jgi:metal-responsive CopG/Arc/MetJ family transcriptional regulator
MHAHACYNAIIMRTTVEMKPQHRSALLALAARRGEKGFSSVLAEAIEEYLNEERTRVQRRKEVLSLAGALSSDEAKTLRSTTKSLRENWR